MGAFFLFVGIWTMVSGAMDVLESLAFEETAQEAPLTGENITDEECVSVDIAVA